MEKRNIGVGFFEATPEMYNNINDVLDTGRISYGPYSKKFEQEFADIHEVEYAVLSASGTDSLRVALHSLMLLYGWKEGSEVIVPATTFVATINVVEQLGLEPVLVDVEPDHYCIDPDAFESAVTNETVAVVPVNLLGQPAALYDIRTLSNMYGLEMIEDSCETMFVSHNDMPVGAWGDAAAFSLYVAHLITAGVGGVSVTNDPEIADTMRSLVNHGRSPVYISIDDDKDLEEDALIALIRKRYAFIHQGYSSRITELQAAIALPQLVDYEAMLARRRRVAGALSSGLGKHSERLQLPGEREAGEHAWMMYGLKTRGEDKWPLLKHLELHGIETREMLPIVNQRVYAGLVSEATKRENSLAVSKDLIRTGFYIGCHPGMGPDDVDYICQVIDDFFQKN